MVAWIIEDRRRVTTRRRHETCAQTTDSQSILYDCNLRPDNRLSVNTIWLLEQLLCNKWRRNETTTWNLRPDNRQHDTLSINTRTNNNKLLLQAALIQHADFRVQQHDLSVYVRNFLHYSLVNVRVIILRRLDFSGLCSSMTEHMQATEMWFLGRNLYIIWTWQSTKYIQRYQKSGNTKLPHKDHY